MLAARKYRIVQQIIENDQRAELSVADRTAAWAQLAFEGVSAAAIAKRTGIKTDAVKKGLAVAESATVTSVLHEHELTLDQAAVLLEFEDDADARANLIEVATHDPARFEHTAQTLRDEAAHQGFLAATAAEYTGNGFQILTRSDAYGDQATWTPVRQLRGEDGKSVTPEQVAAAPGPHEIDPASLGEKPISSVDATPSDVDNDTVWVLTVRGDRDPS
ncbi:hypothetical protein C5C74_08095 [Rathayibacter sp. AY1E8]|uniref:hypothetical protein n=1 Tax=Rathayibacter sp. AY1E8 TaxID=2080555 RepID=UPI000CE79C91|nr:hypothetical protein [Rathayibacter sp. AY1E8]PPG19044.1 hypothetical protein C5C74_08095 [Rathayibacter sp. AY1E8]